MSSTATPPTTDAFDCLRCGACCYQRSGTILIEPSDLVRWKRDRRDDILNQLEPGHFGHMAFKMAPTGACVFHGTADEPHGCHIYVDRSETCIQFERGSKQCLEFRRDRGVVD